MPCALATVVRCEAPTSARPGDKAVITPDGRLRGWIGGSCSEPVVRREALRALDEGTARLVRIVGSTEVQQTRKAGELTVATTCPSGGSLDIFIEPQLPRPLLIAFGDSPAARTLIKAAGLAGFRTCAVHIGARSDEFAGADLVLGSLDLAEANPHHDTWAVAATMGHYDEDAIEAALAYPDVDVALIASTRRTSAVVENLRARGVDSSTIDRVRLPATRVRGASQEEIALLTMAEIIMMRRRRGTAEARADVSPDAFATDPVCGMTVDVATAMHTATHEGQTLYFCCAGCKSTFQDQPAKYAKAVRV
jgi:xanthine dehydrogenase accessory factor